MAGTTMNARDVVSGGQGVAYATIDGTRYKLANIKNLEARADKTKTTVAIMGKSGKGNKATGWEGTGSATFYFNTSILRKLMLNYMKTGQDFYFPIQVTNEDTTTAIGRQTTILIDCNIDGLVMAKLDADADALEEDFDFTFDDVEMPEEFDILPEFLS